MALRDNFDVSVASGRVPRIVDEATAAGMGSLRRGFEAGRIGNELNPLRTEALDAQIAGEAGREQGLRAQIGQLEQRRQLFAPEVGRVEDVDSVGSALSFAGGQLGQGAASMLDPVAVSAGLNTVGRIASALPGPGKLIGGAAQLGALALPAFMSKRQLTGEFIGEAEQDAELLARTSPERLRELAGNYGTLAAIPDSALPAIVGRQLGGFGLRKGLSSVGPGARTALGTLGEGATETLQSVGSQQARALLNPERATSGDFSENLNSFVGGAIGGAPFSAAGAFADAGFRRVGDSAEKLGTAAGDVVDLVNENATVQSAKAAGAKAFGKAKDTVVDLTSDDDGKVSAAALVENLKTVGQDLKSGAQTMLDERSVLNDMPPDDIIADDAKAAAWFDQNAPRREQLIDDKLQALGDDPEAQGLLQALQSATDETRGVARDAAARFVLERMPLGRAENRADALAQALDKAASVAGPAIGKGAVAAGKAVAGFGKAVLSGAKEGLAKKNEQGDTPAAPESFIAWRDRVYGVQGEAAAAQVLDEAAAEFSQRAELAGNYAADMAQRVGKRQPNLALLARHAAFTLADTVMRTNAKGLGQKNIKLNRLVDDLYGAFRTEAPEVLAQLGSIMGPNAAPVMGYMTQELEARMLPNGFKEHAGIRNALAQQVVGLVDPAAQNKLMAQGININTPAGREQMLGLMEDFADGIAKTPGMRQAYEGVFGAESVGRIMELLNGEAEKQGQTQVGETVAEPVDAQEARDAEKLVVKGSGAKVFGFHATKNLRSNSETRDPFAPTEKAGEDGVPKRPALFTKGQQLFGGKGDAIEKKIADVRAQLREDPAYPDHDNYDVRARSALEVMRESNMQPGKILQLYRDYMQSELNSDKAPPEQRRFFAQQMRIANNMIKDGQYGSLGGSAAVTKEDGRAFKSTPGERRELSEAATQYFSERFVVVGEQLSNRDPGKIDITEVMAMNKAGRGLIERSRGETVDGVFKAHPTDVQQEKLNDANVLMFKTKDGELAIPAGKLVNWVRQQRGKSEKISSEDTSGDFSDRSKDEAYLADVMEGIATLIGSGRAQGLPYKINKFGEPESFTNGVADSLRLATMTYGDMKFGEKSRREKAGPVSDEKFQGADQDAVAEDQDRNDEFFTPEDRAERDFTVGDPAGPSTPKRVGAVRAPRAGDEPSTSLARPRDIDKVGREPGEKFADRGADPKTDDDSKTPLDFATRQKDGEVADDFANQRWLSVQTGATTDTSPGPEPKGTAASSAEFRAAKITEAFLSDPAKGQEMVRSRIRTALRPGFVKPAASAPGKDQVVGGVHYIAPVAAFISPKNLAKNNVDLEAKTIQAIQSKVANILLKGDISKTEMLKIARLMAEDPRAVTSFNVKATLERLAGGAAQGKAVVAKQAAAPEVAKAGLPKGQPTRSEGARNQQEGNAKVSTQAERDAATAYATKVLGPKIKVEFKDITGYSGEFIDAKNVIEISTTAAAGTLGTLYHEAMHVFFRDFVKGNPQVQAVFESLINDPKHLAKLHALLDGYPAAQAQLHSGEERLAYTYQFWKAGLLTVDAKAATWLQKVGKFFRRVLGMVRDSERALELFEAFDNGKMSEPSAAGMVIAKALAKGTNAMKLRRQSDALLQGLASLTFPTGEIMARSVSPTARKLGTMFFTNPGEEAHGTEGQGLINAQNAVARKYNNIAHRLFSEMPESDQLAVQKYLQTGTLPKDVPLASHREAVKTIRDLLERFHQQLVDSGMKIGKVENFYPTVWNAGALLAKRPEFTTMLTTKYAQHLGDKPAEAAERIWQSLVNKEGVDQHLPAGREDGVLAPFFASQEGRTLPWIEDVDKEAFLDKNLVNTLTRYFHQGARASEYFRRFGENGIKLEAMLSKINVELSQAGREKMKRGEIKDEAARVKWVARQMRDISQATGAMEGTLGKDVSPNMRKFNSWMAVYQNIRLLPMSLFSSFVDPLGITARGAPLQAAYEAFVFGMKEVFGTWADAFRDMPPARAKDKWRELAEHVGAAEIAMFGHQVADQYSSVYMTPGAKKLNDKMFKFNGMEAWNRGMRVMATKWAVRFIEQHAALPDKTHSARWLKELGLTPAMVHLNAEGELITNRHELAALKGMSLEDATQAMEPIHQAIVRWTEGAVLTPNAAQRPGWASDPNYATMFHLKQFSFSFHQTILKRAVNEFEHGNIAPVGALAMFIPTMIAADITKGLIQGGGSLPPYMASMDAGDWVVHGYQRAGLAGIGNIGMDASADISSLGGPAIEQVVDGLRDPAGKTLLNAAPLHALYANAVR